MDMHQEAAAAMDGEKKKRSQRDDSDERVKGKATRDPDGVRCHAALETYRGGVNAGRLSRALADFVGRH